MGSDIKTPVPRIVGSFDGSLWKAGVDDGAFAGHLDADAAWYILEVGGAKVALANAVPGPGDLTDGRRGSHGALAPVEEAPPLDKLCRM